MSVALLFCTANVPIQTIKTFLQHSLRAYGSSPSFALARNAAQRSLDNEGTTSESVTQFQSSYINWTNQQLAEEVKRRVPDTNGLFLTNLSFAVLDERSVLDETVAIVHLVKRYRQDEEEEEEEQGKEQPSDLEIAHDLNEENPPLQPAIPTTATHQAMLDEFAQETHDNTDWEVEQAMADVDEIEGEGHVEGDEPISEEWFSWRVKFLHAWTMLSGLEQGGDWLYPLIPERLDETGVYDVPEFRLK